MSRSVKNVLILVLVIVVLVVVGYFMFQAVKFNNKKVDIEDFENKTFMSRKLDYSVCFGEMQAEFVNVDIKENYNYKLEENVFILEQEEKESLTLIAINESMLYLKEYNVYLFIKGD